MSRYCRSKTIKWNQYAYTMHCGQEWISENHTQSVIVPASFAQRHKATNNSLRTCLPNSEVQSRTCLYLYEVRMR
jgi:RES domain-containing protein